ncbi:unnamed protein product [Peronospora belbahrii]|uniref:Ankyrin repeat-containing domain n=1 Tax=Peronospora belbahrii TaxID=622444 RepID=A0AAU9LJN2_9STRA|nr:unnamed protein product [Peronospora belbahrii]CAH0519860.1 unnamed protein product [Peronospora belbahrii]
MERIMSVEVVVRDQADSIANGLVPELIESYLDYSTSWSVQNAACSGYMSLLRRLGKRNAEITDQSMDWSLQIAATEGRLDIVKWLTSYRPNVKISTRVMDAAALRGQLNVVKWLHKNRSEGCSVHAMDSAAAGGHVNVIRWLHINRTEGCTTRAIDTAAAGGHLTTVQWLWANRTEGCTSVAIDFAIYNGHFAVVQWFSKLADFQLQTANLTTPETITKINSGKAHIKKHLGDQVIFALNRKDMSIRR